MRMPPQLVMRMPPQLVMRMPPQLESRSRLAEFDSARRRIGEDASNVVDFVVFDEQDEARTALGIRFVEFGALILTDDAIDGICIGKWNFERERRFGDDGLFGGATQTFCHGVAIGSHEPTDAELDAAKMAHDECAHAVVRLPIDRRQYWAPRAPTGLAIVIKSINRPQAISPTIVRRR